MQDNTPLHFSGLTSQESGLLSRERFVFGRFVAVPSARTLLREGKPVYLGGRAFDLLIVLLTSQGEVVSKRDLLHQVWPTTTVDESALRFQMTALRKALGPERDLIKTIPGRGYIIVGHLEASSSLVLKQPADFSSQQRVLSEAITGLLNAFSRCPDALASFERLLMGCFTEHSATPDTRRPSPFTPHLAAEAQLDRQAC